MSIEIRKACKAVSKNQCNFVWLDYFLKQSKAMSFLNVLAYYHNLFRLSQDMFQVLRNNYRKKLFIVVAEYQVLQDIDLI